MIWVDCCILAVFADLHARSASLRGFTREASASLTWVLASWLAWALRRRAGDHAGADASTTRRCACAALATPCCSSAGCWSRSLTALVVAGGRRNSGCWPASIARSAAASACCARRCWSPLFVLVAGTMGAPGPAGGRQSTLIRRFEWLARGPRARCSAGLARAAQAGSSQPSSSPLPARMSVESCHVRHRRHRFPGTPVNQELYDALTMLQHRGQDAAGIITTDGDRLHLRKDNGLVRDVFHADEHMLRLRGTMGIGHVRYPTAGCTTSRRGAAVLHQHAVRHLAGAQRQPDQRRGAQARAVPARTAATSTPTPTPKCCSTSSPTSCCSASTLRLTAGRRVRRGLRRASPLPRRLRLRRA